MSQYQAGATNPALFYAVYRTAASGKEPIGYVVNNILWDGKAPYEPGDGLALVADPDRAYPIGSIYAPAAPVSGQ